MNKISVLSLIGFDHALLLESIATYIDAVDEVILGLAADRKTWAGHEFEVPGSFFDSLKRLDKHNKIKIVEEQFFQDRVDLNFIPNLTYARNMVSNYASEDSWLITLDPDETVVNFKEFADYLRSFTGRNVAIFGKQVTLLKREGSTTFIVENDDWSKDDVCLATQKRGGFILNRYTGEPIAFAPVYLTNNSWARTEDALTTKFEHSFYFARQGFRKFLDELTPTNYQQFKDFNPLSGASWEHIALVEGDLMSYIDNRLSLLREHQAWIAVDLYARAKLFEDKVVGRDSNITELKSQHEKEIAALKSEYETKAASQLRSYKELKMQLDAELLANKARSQR